MQVKVSLKELTLLREGALTVSSSRKRHDILRARGAIAPATILYSPSSCCFERRRCPAASRSFFAALLLLLLMDL